MKWSLALATVCIGRSVVTATPILDTRAVSQDMMNQLAFYEQYSAAAYCSNNNDPNSSPKVTCSSGNCNQVQAADSNTVTEFRDSGLADATGFVAVDKTNKVIVVAYRGSRSVANWLGNANFLQTQFLCNGCNVHRGFLDSWSNTRDKVTQAVASARSANPDFGIVVTGHSLGGAIATLAASELRTKGYNVALYTYGSPMVGNEAYATFVTNQPGGNFRVTHQADAVPKLPGYPLFGYRHVSPQYWISSGNGATVTVNDITQSSGVKDLAGNWGAFGFSILNHLWYFNSIAACTPDFFEVFKSDVSSS